MASSTEAKAALLQHFTTHKITATEPPRVGALFLAFLETQGCDSLVDFHGQVSTTGYEIEWLAMCHYPTSDSDATFIPHRTLWARVKAAWAGAHAIVQSKLAKAIQPGGAIDDLDDPLSDTIRSDQNPL